MMRLQALLIDTPKRLRHELRVAVNATAKQTRIRIGRRIRRDIAIKQSDIMPRIKVKRSTASSNRVTSTITLSESQRLNLKYFGARQTRKGVTARIDRRVGRRLYHGAFMGPKPGVKSKRLFGSVYQRKGPERKPIASVAALSPWGAYVQNPEIEVETLAEAADLLENNMQRRLRFILLKSSGAI